MNRGIWIIVLIVILAAVAWYFWGAAPQAGEGQVEDTTAGEEMMEGDTMMNNQSAAAAVATDVDIDGDMMMMDTDTDANGGVAQ